MYRKYKGLIILCTLYALSYFSNVYIVMGMGRLSNTLGAGAVSTLPVALTYVSLMLMAIPVSKIIMNYGIRKGFLITQAFGFFGNLGILYAIYIQSFPLIIGAVFFVGFSISGMHQMRFIAGDMVDSDKKSIAISAPIATSIIAALSAAPLANNAGEVFRKFSTAPILENAFFIMYLISTLFSAIAIGILYFSNFKRQTKKNINNNTKIDYSILRKDGVIPAILISAVGYGAMTFLMTAVPLFMITKHISLELSNSAIGFHLMGMAIPSLFVGIIIAKYGARVIARTGAILYFITMAVNLYGESSYSAMVLGLITLGIGWCALFISGSTLLSQILSPQERLKIQGVNDMFVFSASGIGGLGAGVAIYYIGWSGINIILGIIAMFTMILSFKVKKIKM